MLVSNRPRFLITKLLPMNKAEQSANAIPTGLCQLGISVVEDMR